MSSPLLITCPFPPSVLTLGLSSSSRVVLIFAAIHSPSIVRMSSHSQVLVLSQLVLSYTLIFFLAYSIYLILTRQILSASAHGKRCLVPLSVFSVQFVRIFQPIAVAHGVRVIMLLTPVSSNVVLVPLFVKCLLFLLIHRPWRAWYYLFPVSHSSAQLTLLNSSPSLLHHHWSATLGECETLHLYLQPLSTQHPYASFAFVMSHSLC